MPKTKIKIFSYLCLLFLCTQLSACAKRSNQIDYSLAINTGGNLNQPINKSNSYTSYTGKRHVRSNKIAHRYSSKNVTGIQAVDAANKIAVRQPYSRGYLDAMMMFNYVPGALYQIYCAPLNVTDVMFEAGERVISVAAGDTLRWQVSKTYSGSAAGARQEHLLLKPVAEGLNNSVVVTTDSRTYHLLLLSTSKTYMASVAWRYPQDDNHASNTADDQNYITDNNINSLVPDLRNFNVDRLDFRYAANVLQGRMPYWAPTLVFNDGRKTYIRFPNNLQEAPTLFVGCSIRSGKIVNYRVAGNYYIIDSVIYTAQLRSGQNGQVILQIVHK
jgi:type IV secretion system protein TrbG